MFACRTPVVSAIGHETDMPLVDYVADVRASTPTDAAKRIVPDLGREFRLIGQAGSASTAPCALLDREQHRLDAIRSRPSIARPLSMVDTRATDVGALRDRAARNLSHRLDRAGTELAHTLARLRALSPAATLSAGTRSCSAPTAAWSAPPGWWRPATPPHPAGRGRARRHGRRAGSKRPLDRAAAPSQPPPFSQE